MRPGIITPSDRKICRELVYMVSSVDVLAREHLWSFPTRAFGRDLFKNRRFVRYLTQHYNVDLLDWAMRNNEIILLQYMILTQENFNKEPSTFIRAVEYYNYSIVQILLQHGANTEVRTRNFTPLLLATKLSIQVSSSESNRMVRALLNASARADVVGLSYRTALYYADSADKTQMLVDAGAPVDVQDVCGRTPLMLADIDQAQILLDRGANVHLVSENGETAFFNACRRGHKEVAALLIAYGSDVNTRSKNKSTALHAWVTSEATHIPEFLHHLVNVQNKEGNTPLHVCVNLEMTKILLTLGADPNRCNNDHETPLYVLIRTQVRFSVTRFEELLKVTDVNIPNFKGKTCLHLVRTNNYTMRLLQAGANVHAESYNGNTVLFKKKNKSTIRTLLQAGVDVNAQNCDGDTALHMCITRTLLRVANLEIRNSKGLTPLHVHCKMKNNRDIKLLVRAGADLHATTPDGDMPLRVYESGCGFKTRNDIKQLLLGENIEPLSDSDSDSDD